VTTSFELAQLVILLIRIRVIQLECTLGREAVPTFRQFLGVYAIAASSTPFQLIETDGGGNLAIRLQ
jgi:hypothetical protein